MSLALPTFLIFAAAAGFLLLERLRPGRDLPHAPGWYGRALLINLCQVAIALAANVLWVKLLNAPSLFHLASWRLPIVEGFIAWFVGTFVFYWWHRLRHAHGFWAIFHQLHHSPARIEALTAFYKHPVEIFADAALAAIVLYPLLGASFEGALWFNCFAAIGELTYHANYRAPQGLKYFIQTPQLHSIHHQIDVHDYNYSDIPLWDRLFGTYLDVDDFAPRCGFPDHNERHLARMLAFRDVYHG